jgi:hypothetical protein
MCIHICKMSYRRTSVGLLCAMLGLYPAFAEAGPCSADIVQFESAIRQFTGNPDAGLTVHQSAAAQNERQPTVASMKKAEQDLKAKFAVTMAHAKRLDARNDRAGCGRVLSVAKRMYIL